ncbi:acyl carrier protein, partial [Streptomyces sp. Amel2xB2]|uniref:acyl carrier protein n=1 Tax=Streptomyces sp. Amel2xB2 TaxID=1305829 RepID=UPI001C654F47
VELRNRLKRATGMPLPATLIFDHPNPTALAKYIRSQLLPDVPAADEAADDPEAQIKETLASIPVSRLRKAGLLDLVLQLADEDGEAADEPASTASTSIEDMDAESLLRLASENSNPEN